MTAIIKNKFRLQNARDFLDNFNSSAHTTSRNHYLFIGKPTVWGTGSISAELSPPAPLDTYESEARIWDEMLGLKKIDSATTSLVIRRSDWTEGTVYAIYDDRDADLHNQPTQARVTALSPTPAGNFYVITDTLDIFVCLENGNNAASTVKPEKQNPATNLIYYAQDGYVWKYVASVSSANASKFLTDSWVPVKTLSANDGSSQWTVQAAAVPGEVMSVVVENGGSGYTRTYTGTVTTIGTNGQGKGTAILSTGSPSEADDFYNNGQIHITSGSGINEIYTIEDYIGGTKQIILTAAWSGNVTTGNTCQILPKLNVVTNGTDVKLRPVVNLSGAITKILPITRGSNSTFISVSVENSLGGTGAIVRPILSDLDGLGKDVEKDLNSIFIMMNAKLQYAEGEGDFPTDNDYRQLGIIRDVRNYDGTLATDTTRISTKKLNLTGVTNANALVYDQIFQISPSIQGVALQYTKTSAEGVSPETGTLTFIQNPTTGYGTFTNGSTITQSTFSAQIASTNGVVNEEIKKGAGNIIYIENRRAIIRSQNQIEDIKAIVEF
jgi:surface antigen